MKNIIPAAFAPTAFVLCLAAGSVAAASVAQADTISHVSALGAEPAKGQWSVEVTAVATRAHFNTIRVCLNADHSWYNTVQPSGSQPGSGKWLVNGSSLLWRGNMGRNLDDAAVLTVTGPSSMSGPLMQWVKDTPDTTNVAIDNVFATSVWTYVSATCDAALN